MLGLYTLSKGVQTKFLISVFTLNFLKSLKLITTVIISDGKVQFLTVMRCWAICEINDTKEIARNIFS